MERILSVHNYKNIEYIIFEDKMFYLVISDNKDRYEANIFENQINLNAAKEIQNEISSFLSLIDSLNLTLKIYK